ncbi:Sec-independent protein translocase protein TatB [Sphingosinicella sp. BN140058]|uniref:Sec-independent protein translocase protein TatB n=1 Tax=Sphingosinicella sp. BN140058 TaxID=1892855 RepID=UPI0010128F72|nr:Sec-independent protein translocase protein TatB [Sphingosinicella sp. BN140058]QAY77363.1 twin-arginine translocase subunit TatB [Sphingosinicella sp. BN140058]
MFDIGYSELLVVAIVALIVIGPKDLPRVMRTVGQWVGRARGMARHFRSGIDTMIREAELEEMEKKWREENERIMREHPLGTSWDDPVALAAPVTDPAPAPPAAAEPWSEPQGAEDEDVGERGTRASDHTAAAANAVPPRTAPPPAAEPGTDAPAAPPASDTQLSFLSDPSPRGDESEGAAPRRELP